LLYAGQSRRLFELRPGMLWPDDSWLFSKLLDERLIRWLAVIALASSALGFVAGGLGLLIRQDGRQPLTVSAALLSSALFIVFWDGKPRALDGQGGIGVLINLMILVIVLILKWPL
jgi:cytochrome bd-type quinol oxidase subunit 1